uniref:50S ribosomal protein L6 n=1 Tax=Nephromyces sp. ex Molgula occidentalis TaxID=2544991 RepID=A0A5C1H952_9APIC|nr:50S ribosomal protein L6 [Nephromyces sp. ex Molgula occidentalis]
MNYIQKLNLKNNTILNILDNKTKINRLLIKYEDTYIYLNIINFININIGISYLYLSLTKNNLISKSFFIMFKNLISKNILNNSFNYTLKLNIFGIGYFFKIIKKDILSIQVEKTHLINIKLPKEINYSIENNGTLLILNSHNKQVLTLIGSKIKLLSKQNKYKGKGIYYFNDKINLKQKKNLKNKK